MSDPLAWWTDVTSEGVIVRCNDAGEGSLPVVQFGTDTPLPLPSHGLFLRAWGNEALCQSQSGVVFKIIRGVGAYPQGPQYGTNATAMNALWRCYQDSPTTYRRNGVPQPIPAVIAGTSQGMLDLSPDGYPIWTDLNRTRVIKGVTFTLPITRGHWTAGQGDDEHFGIVAYHAPTDTLWGVLKKTSSPVAPHLAQLADGSCVVALSMPGQAIHSSAFVPYTVVPPDPPVPPIPPVPPDPPVPPIIKDTMTSIVLESIKAQTVDEVAHPDGHGLVALKRADGKFLTCDANDGSLRWSASAGAWEQFHPGTAYTAVRDGGTWIIQKGGTWQ